MITISKNSFFFWLILITTSTNLCADGKGWLPSIKTYFSSFQILRSFATFERPKLNQKWLGVGALAIASGILAYRYFKRPPGKKEWKDTAVKDTGAKASDLFPSQEIDFVLNNQNAAQLKLDNTLDEVDKEIVATQNPMEAKFAIGDVVKVANNSLMKLRDFNLPVNEDYLNHVGIIRNIAGENLDVEIRVIGKPGKGMLDITSLFIIQSKNLKKMALTDPTNENTQEKTLVKFSLNELNQSQFQKLFKSTVKNTKFIEPYLNLPLIGNIQTINTNGYQIQCYFPIDPETYQALKPQIFKVLPKNMKVIFDPDTNRPITIK